MFNFRALLMFLWTVVWSLIGALALIVDWRGRLFMYLARVGWAPQVLWLGGVRVIAKVSPSVDWREPYVVVANHQSQVDIPILFAELRMPIRFLAKRSLFFIPIFGWAMWGARFIPIDRGASRKARGSIEKAAARIRKGPSLIVFPEGTRTPDGQLQPFKSGAFVMSTRAGVRILPVAIRGSYDIIPKQRLSVRPGTVELVVGTPISAATVGEEGGRDKLRALARERIEEMLRTGQPV